MLILSLLGLFFGFQLNAAQSQTDNGAIACGKSCIAQCGFEENIEQCEYKQPTKQRPEGYCNVLCKYQKLNNKNINTNIIEQGDLK